MSLGSISLEKADFPKSTGRKAAQLPLLLEVLPTGLATRSLPRSSFSRDRVSRKGISAVF